MRFIYWNTKKNSDASVILEILNEEFPDVLFLSETEESLILNILSQLDSINYKHFENPGCDRIKIIARKNLNVSLSKQSTYYSALRDSENDVTIVSVHLPSQLYQNIDGLKGFMRDFRHEIDQEIGSSVNDNIILIGDFNINPFDKPMIDFDGFSASNSKTLKKESVHLSKRKSLYYNPTWMLYAKNNFPGTIYYRRPSAFSYDVLEHHFLDQVLLSYNMSQNIFSEKISILEKTTHHTFFDATSNSIKLSDHLPLIYEYKIA